MDTTDIYETGYNISTLIPSSGHPAELRNDILRIRKSSRLDTRKKNKSSAQEKHLNCRLTVRIKPHFK